LPELSIVIPVYGNWWLTARCLRELERLRESGATKFETIVVDNASSDETPDSIESFPWVRYLRNDENRNFAGACNAGARLAAAPLTLFLNNDAYPMGDALTPLTQAFTRPEVAIAGGALFFEDGVTQAAGLVLLRNAHWHYSYRNLPSQLDAVTEWRDALAVSGAAMMVRTQWFVAQGGFDESFVNGFEDVDLCLRARAQDQAIVYAAGAQFAHYEAASAGRFAREAENERRFYAQWSAALGALPRTARGEVGAISVGAADPNSLVAAARSDLEDALRAFGHPVVRGSVARWRLLDRRFRRDAAIGWFTKEIPEPGIAIRGRPLASIRTVGAVDLEVPWLPCAAEERVERLRLQTSEAPSCDTVAFAGDDEMLHAALKERYPVLKLAPEMLLEGVGAEVACVVHAGVTDETAFGTVLLAQAGVASVVVASDALRGLFASDVALVRRADEIPEAVAAMIADPNMRRRYGALVAADARRRFSPRRSAIRVVDLLCTARFGLERPAAARSNTPL